MTERVSRLRRPISVSVHPKMTGPVMANQWVRQLFAAKAVKTGGVVRRSVRDVVRHVGQDALMAEVARRRFHAIICGDQFIIICNTGKLQLMATHSDGAHV